MLAIAQAYIDDAQYIWRFLNSRVRDPDVADDLLSEVFVSACRDAARYEDRGLPIGAWLFRIARSRLGDYLRAQRRRASADPLDWHRPSNDGGIGAIERRADAALLRHALAQLTPLQQQVMVLRFVQDMEIGHVARVLDRSIGAVKAAQHRATVQMAQVLGVVRPSSAAQCPCGRPAHARGLCTRHYQQQQRAGR